MQRKKDQTNIPQVPFPKLSHPEGIHKFQTTDPARLPGAPVKPQTSEVSSLEAQKHCIEFLMNHITVNKILKFTCINTHFPSLLSICAVEFASA